VVQEENRMRNQPGSEGELLRDFAATAFEAFPYRIRRRLAERCGDLRRGMAQAFFDKYYVPANINLAIVGDVDPAQARRLAERYFGPMPARPAAAARSHRRAGPGRPENGRRGIAEPAAVRRRLQAAGQDDADDPVYEVISLILSGGRTSLLYKGLVQEKKIAIEVEASPAYPSSRYPNLFRHLRRSRGGAHGGGKTKRRWRICWRALGPENRRGDPCSA